MGKVEFLCAVAGALLVGFSSFIGAGQAETGKSVGVEPKAVVELFTSQGCSSCPAADKVLGEIKAEGEIFALAWHVDYWDYIGWKDTFATPEFTNRQRSYAQSLGERQIYTPQAIVNGYDHTVGSQRSRINGLIEGAKSADAALNIPVELTDDGAKYGVQIKTNSGQNDLHVFAVFYKDQAKVKITRGENRGETLVYNNIVVGAKDLGSVSENGFSGAVSKADLKANGADGLAVLVQSYGKNIPHKIHGAKFIH